MAAVVRPRRILVLTLSFGSGHVRAASAVEQALRTAAPDADVRVVDALTEAWWPFRAIYVWPYWLMLRYCPGVWRRLFEARLRHQHSRTAPDWLFRLGCSRVFTTIARFEPDVIVATEVAASEIARMARRGGAHASIVNVITDHHAEPAWVTPDADAYAVADAGVAEQLTAWGARSDRIVVSGIPTATVFDTPIDPQAVRARYGLTDDRPLVLLMGGGMGPTRMDVLARDLCASGQPMHIVAVAGLDRRTRRRLSRVESGRAVSLTVLGWTDDVPALMRSAALLVTKPGGVTTAEAAVCGCPAVFFDAIPGPEEHNAAWAVGSGGCIHPHGRAGITGAVVELLRDDGARATMSARARERGAPMAAAAVAGLALNAANERDGDARRPLLILTIRNGAGHTQVARAVADAVKRAEPATVTSVVDVADYMSFAARMTHVTIFLWLVRYTPRLWARIDRYQKRQTQTSPEWYYRRGCARLFALVRQLRPAGIVATEVGCCEIAALVTRDLGLGGPVIAVNGEYDADRAWVQPEVALYCVPDAKVAAELCGHGADPRRVRSWGVPLASRFLAPPQRDAARALTCARLRLEADRPIVLVSGGSEALGAIDTIVERLLQLSGVVPQVVVLAGRNGSVQRRCEALAERYPASSLRVLGWTSDVRELMAAADVMVSKLGHTFDEAVALGLPIVALEPPPGSEQVQYRLLDEWGVGRAVRNLDEMAAAVATLLTQPPVLAAMRAAAAARPRADAAQKLAGWIVDRALNRSSDESPAAPPRALTSSSVLVAQGPNQ